MLSTILDYAIPYSPLTQKKIVMWTHIKTIVCACEFCVRDESENSYERLQSI